MNIDNFAELAIVGGAIAIGWVFLVPLLRVRTSFNEAVVKAVADRWSLWASVSYWRLRLGKRALGQVLQELRYERLAGRPPAEIRRIVSDALNREPTSERPVPSGTDWFAPLLADTLASAVAAVDPERWREWADRQVSQFMEQEKAGESVKVRPKSRAWIKSELRPVTLTWWYLASTPFRVVFGYRPELDASQRQLVRLTSADTLGELARLSPDQLVGQLNAAAALATDQPNRPGNAEVVHLLAVGTEPLVLWRFAPLPWFDPAPAPPANQETSGGGPERQREEDREVVVHHIQRSLDSLLTMLTDGWRHFSMVTMLAVGLVISAMTVHVGRDPWRALGTGVLMAAVAWVCVELFNAFLSFLDRRS